MRLCTCLHPRKIKNPYSGEDMFVPCGKCSACRTKKSFDWTSRLEQERQCWTYCVFFTLTYDPQFCPFCTLIDDRFVAMSDGEVVDLYDYDFEHWSEDDIDYLLRNKTVNVLDFTDVQKFVKRLRYYFKITENEKRYQNFRYYISGEYAPKHNRPHYHGLLFFNGQEAFRSIEQLLFKAWSVKRHGQYTPIGIIDVQSVQTTASSYVASYVNGFYDLPRIYTVAGNKPRAIFSKRPPIGTLLANDVQTAQIFFTSAVKISVPNFTEYVTIPLWKSFANRLFPTFRGFSELSHVARVSVVSLLQRQETWSDCLAFCAHQCQLYETPFTTWIHQTSEGFTKLSGLKRAWRVAKRIKVQSDLFHVSIDFYIGRIEEYLSNYNYEQLRSQLEYEEEYTSPLHGKHDVRELIALDILFYYNRDKFSEKDRQLIVSSYGFDSYYDYVSSDYVGYNSVSDYADLSATSELIALKKNKAKKNNVELNKWDVVPSGFQKLFV